MAEEMIMFGVATGMFAVLAGVVFSARARRYSSKFTPVGEGGQVRKE